MEQDNNTQKNRNPDTLISTKHYNYVCKNLSEFKEIQRTQFVYDSISFIFFIILAILAINLIGKIIQAKFD